MQFLVTQEEWDARGAYTTDVAKIRAAKERLVRHLETAVKPLFGNYDAWSPAPELVRALSAAVRTALQKFSDEEGLNAPDKKDKTT